MKTLSALVVDDVSTTARTFSHWIEMALQLGLPGFEISVAYCTDPDEARLKLNEVDLLVTDIVWKKASGDPENLGLPLITEARTRRPNDLAIVAMSGESAEGLDKARELGADETLSKKYLVDRGADPAFVAEVLLRALKKNQFETTGVDGLEILQQDDSLESKALMGWIGEENIKRIIRGLVGPSCFKVTISTVRPGLSGATVLGAECLISTSSEESRFSRNILLKISRDRDLIMGEHARRQENYQRFPEDIFPRVLETKPVTSGGWTAISQEFVTGAKTLTTWLKTGANPQNVESAFEDLYSARGMAKHYVEQVISKSKKRKASAIQEILGTWRGARVLASLPEIKALVDGKAIVPMMSEFELNTDLILNFVEHGRVGEVDPAKFPKGALYVRSHGDLHGDNLLVRHDSRLQMVDPANIDDLPWCGDVARLSVDLFLRSYAHDWRAHDWTDLEGWMTDFEQAFINPESLISENPALRGVAWLVKLSEDLGQKTEVPVTTWEIHLAIAVELLRGCYRVSELPAPKRVLAAFCACRSLRSAESLFRADQ